jgi:hypothetical protein
MTEHDRVECPFCGLPILMIMDKGTHVTNNCMLSAMCFPKEQWAMRPPKKEAPQGKAILSEVEWLRQMVAALTIEPKPNHTVEYISMPDGIYASREGTAK